VLKAAIDSLPMEWYGVGNAAYTLDEHLLTPFTGVGKFDLAHDAFNYYLWRLDVWWTYFGYLSGKIVGSMDRVSAILTACTRLHNFIICEDKPFTKSFATADEDMIITLLLTWLISLSCRMHMKSLL
jgi:hypothetical protein